MANTSLNSVGQSKDSTITIFLSLWLISKNLKDKNNFNTKLVCEDIYKWYLKKMRWRNLTRLWWSSFSVSYWYRSVHSPLISFSTLEGKNTLGSVSPTKPHLSKAKRILLNFVLFISYKWYTWCKHVRCREQLHVDHYREVAFYFTYSQLN